MLKYLFRHNKDYSRFNILKQFTKNIQTKSDIYILLPFSKNQFFKHFFKRDKIINDFFISNYDTYVYDRKKITKKNPRAWWKFFQDWFNFRFSKYLLSDTNEHFKYWESLFGEYRGKHFVFPVLADKDIYFPNDKLLDNEKVRILFYGSFIPLHGIDIILKAFKILELQGIDFDAKIIGKGQMFSQMKDLFDELDLKNVQMNGEIINEKELSQEIRKFDILLGIFGQSKKAKSVVPNKVYQALASKKAIITMNSIAIDEFFGEKDLLTCKNTPEELAENIKRLVLDRKELDRIANSGYSRFIKLYDDTELNFQNFIKKIDSSIDVKK